MNSNLLEDNLSEELSSDNNTIISSSSDEIVEHANNLDLQGNILKNYYIITELGRGSYSIVWLAYHKISNKFYAVKVHDLDEYKSGLDEIKFVKLLPKNPPIFNNLIEYFNYTNNNNKYLCSVWNLHYFNIDTLLRKCNYNNGLPFNVVIKIMKNLINSIYILHKKFKVFHGDIKTDNILIKGVNNYIKLICTKYLEEINKNKLINNHNEITKIILEDLSKLDINMHDIDDNFINNINISLSDFGTFCNEKDYYTGTFGTRYYQAPEIILFGKCSYPVDIWALGCTFYELLSGNLLFNPIKDSKGSRDYYHLCLINDTCGIFPYTFIKKTERYNDFFSNNKLINYISTYDNNNTRLDNKINDLSIGENNKLIVKKLLSSMLSIDPLKRCNIEYLQNEINKL